MKLTKVKVRIILRQNRKEVATKEIARDIKVTQRRVQQVLKDSREIGHEPVYGENVGRLRRPYDDK
jgi:putative transposase